RRPGARLARLAPIVTLYASVFLVAKPMPGKCFIVGSTPFERRPEAKASARRAVREALNENVRPSRYMNEAVDAGTSATGAKSTLIPRPRRAAPVFAPCVRAIDALPS